MQKILNEELRFPIAMVGLLGLITFVCRFLLMKFPPYVLHLLPILFREVVRSACSYQ